MSIQLRIWYKRTDSSTSSRARTIMTKIRQITHEANLGSIPNRRIYHWEPTSGKVNFLIELRIIDSSRGDSVDISELVQKIETCVANYLYAHESFNCIVIKEEWAHKRGNGMLS